MPLFCSPLDHSTPLTALRFWLGYEYYFWPCCNVTCRLKWLQRLSSLGHTSHYFPVSVSLCQLGGYPLKVYIGFLQLCFLPHELFLRESNDLLWTLGDSHERKVSNFDYRKSKSLVRLQVMEWENMCSCENSVKRCLFWIHRLWYFWLHLFTLS